MERRRMEKIAGCEIPLKVLSLEDSVRDFEIIRAELELAGFELDIIRVDTQNEFTAHIREINFDLILADFNLPGFQAFEALNLCNEFCPEVPFICVSGAIGEEIAIELLKKGAVDYVMKDKLERLPLAILRALSEAKEKTALKKAEENLRISELKYRSLVENALTGVYSTNHEGYLLFANRAFSNMLGYESPDDLSKKNVLQFYARKEDRDVLINKILKSHHVHNHELKLLSRRGAEIDVLINSFMSENIITGMMLDISERKRAEKHAKLSSKILSLLNTNESLQKTIEQVLLVIQKETEFDAVGLRFKVGNDYPYYSYQGFSNEFIRAENSLISLDQEGAVCRDKDGRLCLECSCGLVISGKIKAKSKLFTEGGSFWTNDSSSLLELKGGKDPRQKVRNLCVTEGYLSFAIIPIRANEDIVGLLQLNDHKKNRLNLEMVRYFENVADIIGTTLLRKQAEEELEKSHRLLFKLSEQVPGVIYQFRLFPDGRSCFPYASSGMNEIYEVTPSEVREDATPVYGRIHPDDSDRVSELIFESARTLNHYYSEFRVILPRQGLRWRYSDAVPEKLDDGSILWHGIIYDITNLKEAETNLNKRMEELQRFNNLTVDRELYMIELKKEVNELLKKSGQSEKYRIVE